MNQQQQVEEDPVEPCTPCLPCGCDDELVGNDMLEFLRRMNQKYVNNDGTIYLEFNFRGTVISGGLEKMVFSDSIIRYYDKNWCMLTPFEQETIYPYMRLVQCVVNEVDPPIPPLIKGDVILPTQLSPPGTLYTTKLIDECLGNQCALVYNRYCFVGTIKLVNCDNFYNDSPVQDFFNIQYPKLGVETNCFADEKGKTFFVLTGVSNWAINIMNVEPEMVISCPQKEGVDDGGEP